MTTLKTFLATILIATSMNACVEVIDDTDESQNIPVVEVTNTDTHEDFNEDPQEDVHGDTDEDVIEDTQLVVNEDPNENTQEDIDTSTFEHCNFDADREFYCTYMPAIFEEDIEQLYHVHNPADYEFVCEHNPADIERCVDRINSCDGPYFEMDIFTYVCDHTVAIVSMRCEVRPDTWRDAFDTWCYVE